MHITTLASTYLPSCTNTVYTDHICYSLLLTLVFDALPQSFISENKLLPSLYRKFKRTTSESAWWFGQWDLLWKTKLQTGQ